MALLAHSSRCALLPILPVEVQKTLYQTSPSSIATVLVTSCTYDLVLLVSDLFIVCSDVFAFIALQRSPEWRLHSFQGQGWPECGWWSSALCQDQGTDWLWQASGEWVCFSFFFYNGSADVQINNHRVGGQRTTDCNQEHHSIAMAKVAFILNSSGDTEN